MYRWSTCFFLQMVLQRKTSAGSPSLLKLEVMWCEWPDFSARAECFTSDSLFASHEVQMPFRESPFLSVHIGSSLSTSLKLSLRAKRKKVNLVGSFLAFFQHCLLFWDPPPGFGGQFATILTPPTNFFIFFLRKIFVYLWPRRHALLFPLFFSDPGSVPFASHLLSLL